MAKGVEDTAFYRYQPPASRSTRSAATPARFGLPLADFHARHAAERRHAGRAAMLATVHPRHQAQRGRAGPPRTCCRRSPARGRRPCGAGTSCTAPPPPATTGPDRERRVPPLPDARRRLAARRRARCVAYMEKATREAKVHTSWTAPDPAYDAAVRGLRRRRARRRGARRRPRRRSSAPLVEPGRVNSLAQTAAQAHRARACPTSTRAPSCGTCSLVDPDNRRPVDYDAPAAAAGRVHDARAAGGAGASPDDGLPKLLAHRARRSPSAARRPDAFGPAAPTSRSPSQGPEAQHVVAFARGDAVATVVPRLVVAPRRGLGRARRSSCRPGAWRDALTRPSSTAAPSTWPRFGKRSPSRCSTRRTMTSPDLSSIPTLAPAAGPRAAVPVAGAVGRRPPRRRAAPRWRRLALERQPDGWWRRRRPRPAPGERLRVRRSTAATRRPDPRSPVAARRHRTARRAVVDHDAFAWTDAAVARRRRSPRRVLYELHVGTFTPAGTFDGGHRPPATTSSTSASTHVELMPVARVLRRPRLGLRRRRPVRARTTPTAAPTG